MKDSISIAFLKDTVTTSYGETFSNLLEIKNYSDSSKIIITHAIDPQAALIGLPDTIRLIPHYAQSFPVKYLTSSKTLHSILQQFSFTLEYLDGTHAYNLSFWTKLDQPERVRVFALEPVVYIDQQTDLGVIKLKCVNDGYINQVVQLSASVFPQGLEIAEPARALELKPGEEQIISFDVHNVTQKKYAPDFTVNIQTTNADGKSLATTVVRTVLLTSDKRLTIGNSVYANLLRNSVELAAINSSNGPSYFLLHANGREDVTDEAKIKYNLGLNYYTQNITGFEAYDSWIDFSNKQFGARVGNIYENLDYPIYGRGIKGTLHADKRNDVDVYLVNQNYQLFSEVNKAQPAATVIAANYTYHGNENKGGNLSYVHSNNPVTNQITNLVNGQTTIKLNKENNINIYGGYSFENINGKRNTGEEGYAGGIIYNLHTAKWDLALNNYMSSAYYSGLRRGALQLDERIGFMPNKKTTVYVRYTKLNNDPRFLPEIVQLGGNFNNTNSYEFGFTRLFGKRFFLSMRPYLFTQKLQEYNFGITSLKDVTSISERISADLRYSMRENTASIMIDYGNNQLKNDVLAGRSYQSARVNANFSAKSWSFNAYAQVGPYYITDALGQDPASFRSYSMGPNGHFTFLDKKLEAFGGYNIYYYSSANVVSHTLNLMAKYNTEGHWQFCVQELYSSYHNTNSFQTRISVTKYFAEVNAPGYKTLELIFYGDENANGIWDDGEKAIPDIVVDIAGSLAVTNAKGRVSFSNLPKGEQHIQLVTANGWYQADPTPILLERNGKIKVPLIKSGRLLGKLNPVKGKYDTKKMLLEGIRVTATDDQNHSFTTITDEAGNFSFSLPANHYLIQVQSAGLSFSVINAHQEVLISPDHNAEMIFNVKDSTREVEVKRF